MVHEKKMQVLQSQLGEERQELMNLKSQVQNHEVNISELETSIENYACDIRDFDSKKQSYLSDITKLKDFTIRQISEIKGLKSKAQQYTYEITELETRKHKINIEVENQYNEAVGPYVSLFRTVDRFTEDTMNKITTIINRSDGVPGLHEIRREIIASQSEMQYELKAFTKFQENKKQNSVNNHENNAQDYQALNGRHSKSNNVRR
jgi:chromosome segregation ATPase